MRCRLVTSGENHALGEDDCKSVKDAMLDFEAFAKEVGRFGERESAEGLIYIGDCDYPEWQLSVGPRGGIRRGRC